jgi:hypothetical protein
VVVVADITDTLFINKFGLTDSASTAFSDKRLVLMAQHGVHVSCSPRGCLLLQVAVEIRGHA